MKNSKVLRKLRAGEIVSCVKLNLDSSRAAEMAAMAGFDCLWLCMEHVPNDLALIERQILAAKAYDADTMVRVPRGCYSDYIRPLELDATGIMVPHIMSLEDAKNVVRMTRFFPIGRRPIDGGNSDGDFCAAEMVEYMEFANRERFITVQIEDPEPLDDLDAIAALDGIDMLFFGPADFSQGIGAPGQWNDERIIETRKRVAQAATKHGKFAGTTGNVNNIEELVDLGYTFLPMGSDVRTLTGFFNDTAFKFAQTAKKLGKEMVS
ncbi:aldolase [bacterium]|nr:aldolase [bacterium]